MMRQAYLSFAWGLVLVWPLVLNAQSASAQEAPPPAGAEVEGMEVLTRGPIHEAFAEPLTEPQPTMIVPKPPPEDVQELPPEYAPDVEGATWIHGYWAWDDERDDYIWISGVQRVPPPGMRWVAGYWSEVEGGWQWTPGFWADAEVEELSYHDTPPESLEEGPSSPSPGEDYFWVPGNWVYQEVDYHWTPGYWAVHRPDWVWVPARWVWTPHGCIFLAGRWDYVYALRGALYSPVYFNQPLYARPGYFYRPLYALNIGNLFVHFWVRPNYCHYYYGNYYGNFDRWGLRPWHSYGRRFGYDPMLSWYNVHYRRRGINYTDRIAGWHRYYERHEGDRPPRTWNEHRQLANRVNITNITEINKVTNVVIKQNFLTARVDHLASMENSPVRLRRLDETQQRQVEQRARRATEEIIDLRQQRRQLERQVARDDRPEGAADVAGRGPDADKAGPAGARGKGKAGVAGQTREGQRRGLRLPRSEVAATQPRVEVPERPDRGRPGRGPESRGARTQDDRTAEADRPDRGRGPDRATGPDRPAGSERPGAVDRPGSRGPGGRDDATKGRGAKGDLPGARPDSPDARERPEAPPRGDRPRGLPGADDRPGAGPRVERPEGGRPDRGPRGPRGPERGPGKAPRSAERPEIDAPSIDRPEPRVERPEPRIDRPEPRIERPEPRVERPTPRVDRPEPRIDRPEPRIERPEPRIERPEPRIERPEPRIERPEPRIERPEPRIERPEPRVERPTPRVDRPEPRVERPTPRVERSTPRIERPTPRVERPSPRIERPEPRVERSRPEVRVERPQTRAERSRPEPRAERSSSSRPERSNRGRGKDRD